MKECWTFLTYSLKYDYARLNLAPSDVFIFQGGLLLSFSRKGPEDEDIWIDLGNGIKVGKPAEEVDPTDYTATLQFHTPWEALPLMRISTHVHSVYQGEITGNLTIVANKTWFSAEAKSWVSIKSMAVPQPSFCAAE